MNEYQFAFTVAMVASAVLAFTETQYVLILSALAVFAVLWARRAYIDKLDADGRGDMKSAAAAAEWECERMKEQQAQDKTAAGDVWIWYRCQFAERGFRGVEYGEWGWARYAPAIQGVRGKGGYMEYVPDKAPYRPMVLPVGMLGIDWQERPLVATSRDMGIAVTTRNGDAAARTGTVKVYSAPTQQESDDERGRRG